MDQNNNNQPKGKFTANDFSEFIHTPRGKAVLFFGIYLVFFIVLAMMAHIGGQGSVIGSTDLNLDSPYYDLSSIKEGNYAFSYQFVIDGVTSTYTGTHYDKKALFSDEVNQYYQDDTLFMRMQDGVWIRSDAPYPLSSLTDANVIENLLESATYVSRTELATGEEAINYQISTTTLVLLLDGLEVDLDDAVNTIQLQKDENGEIVEIQYDVSSYAKYRGLATDHFRFTLSYSDFGEIEEITQPS